MLCYFRVKEVIVSCNSEYVFLCLLMFIGFWSMNNVYIILGGDQNEFFDYCRCYTLRLEFYGEYIMLKQELGRGVSIEYIECQIIVFGDVYCVSLD